MHRCAIQLRTRTHRLVHEGLPLHRKSHTPICLFQNTVITDFGVTRIELSSTSTVNATSEFRKIRQSLSLLESHLTTLQRVPRLPSDAPPCETRTQPQRGLLAHLSSPLSSRPTQLNPGVGPTGWISYLGMRVRFHHCRKQITHQLMLFDARHSAAARSARRIIVSRSPQSQSTIG